MATGAAQTMIRIRRHQDARAFLGRARDWLLLAEAENNLTLGIAEGLIESTEGFEPPIYLATVEVDDSVAGCAFRTPPFQLAMTRMPDEAVSPLINDVSLVYDSLPGVAGVEPQLSLLADLWYASHSTSFQPGMSQRIYQLTDVTSPVPPAPGSLRPAGPEDVNLVSEWVGAFTAEAGANVGAIRSYVEKGIAQKAIYLWTTKGRPRWRAGPVGRHTACASASCTPLPNSGVEDMLQRVWRG